MINIYMKDKHKLISKGGTGAAKASAKSLAKVSSPGQVIVATRLIWGYLTSSVIKRCPLPTPLPLRRVDHHLQIRSNYLP